MVEKSLDVDSVKLSRTMCALLRHGVEGFRVDSEGWADIGYVAEKLSALLKKNITESDVVKVAENDSVGRYEIDYRNGRIRALYGHSIPVKIEYRRVGPRDVNDELYHGTVKERLEKILEEGLKPLKRNWVHMYDSFELAVERSRRRRGSPTILIIDAKSLASTYKLYRAGKHVYVSKYVPQRFIKNIIPLPR